MQQRYEDCRCEDYPCCGHYDILHGDEGQPDHCDICGGYHVYGYACQWDDDDEEYEDDEPGPFDDEPRPVRVNAFGQRLRDDAPELPGDHYIAEDAHLDASWEERFEING